MSPDESDGVIAVIADLDKFDRALMERVGKEGHVGSDSGRALMQLLSASSVPACLNGQLPASPLNPEIFRSES